MPDESGFSEDLSEGLRRAKSMPGLPVLMEGSLKRIGSVTGIAYRAGAKTIDGIFMKRNGITIRPVFVAFDAIQIGAVSVLILKGRSDDAAGTKYGAQRPFMPPVVARVTTGKVLGLMRDVLFDPVSGRVHALEISTGFFEDYTRGRMLALRFASAEFAREILVQPETDAD